MSLVLVVFRGRDAPPQTASISLALSNIGIDRRFTALAPAYTVSSVPLMQVTTDTCKANWSSDRLAKQEQEL